MFSWNGRDQVGGAVWPNYNETKDHIVPHPMETEEDALFPGVEYEKFKRDEGLTSLVQCTEQSAEAKHSHISYRSDGSSGFQTNEELSSSQAEIDSWLDFPNLCIELKDDYSHGNNHNPVMESMNDLTDGTSLNSVRGEPAQLHHESGLIGHEDNKENDDFLECDWATFGDFDDIEKLFRKDDSIFGHDMIGDADGLLSPSKDVIDSAAQSILMPDLPLCKNQTSDEGCSSFQSDDHTDKQRSPLCKEKVDGQKLIPGSQNKAEEKGKNRLSRNIKESYNQNQNNASISIQSSVTTPLKAFQSKPMSQEMQFGDAKRMGDQGYPTNCLPGVQFSSNVIEKNQKRPVPSTYDVRSGDTKHPKISNRLQDGTPGIMTAQEKMEKLRQLQKMQAQLAIEKQQLQYNHQPSDADVSAPQCSTLTYESPSEEVIYCQLRDVVEKLDIRTRLCIRDSLFRLARSAMERQSASDRSSTNKSNREEDEVSADEELRNYDRRATLADPETDTNPIDRIVANLLFQRPTEACSRIGSYLLSST
ncbi:uncharacterized protein A4U43_C07F16210 [Asparagus officinalis]|uniref:Protein LNK2 n=1 Tax=Asparagus officinalis TaxID=4686 RepID=A0A5P1ECM9_ASPOF|nr:protein LNK2 isoform X1 [Asparagus officinalis]XP_020275498.1 protein LNK2 isoform X2 [Asparagus officinalis]ONK63533.1 uncharacterized protein A4U43_C07F16210 [Asparagus officinalis]